MTLICMQDKDNIVLYANKHHIMSRDLKQWHSDLKMTFISACGLFRETGIPNNQCSSHCVNMTQKKTCFYLELLWLVVSLKTGSGKIKTGVDSRGQNTTPSVWMTHINSNKLLLWSARTRCQHHCEEMSNISVVLIFRFLDFQVFLHIYKFSIRLNSFLAIYTNTWKINT